MVPCDIALADDIVQELNGRWPDRFVAERTWVPDWDCRVETDTLRVAVQPGPDPSGERTERGDDDDQPGIWEVWPIDIGFAQRLTAKTRAEIDGLVTLVDEVRSFLQSATFQLPDGRLFDPQGFQFLARFDPTLLDRQLVENRTVYAGEFLSMFRIPYSRLD